MNLSTNNNSKLSSNIIRDLQKHPHQEKYPLKNEPFVDGKSNSNCEYSSELLLSDVFLDGISALPAEVQAQISIIHSLEASVCRPHKQLVIELERFTRTFGTLDETTLSEQLHTIMECLRRCISTDKDRAVHAMATRKIIMRNLLLTKVRAAMLAGEAGDQTWSLSFEAGSPEEELWNTATAGSARQALRSASKTTTTTTPIVEKLLSSRTLDNTSPKRKRREEVNRRSFQQIENQNRLLENQKRLLENQNRLVVGRKVTTTSTTTTTSSSSSSSTTTNRRFREIGSELIVPFENNNETTFKGSKTRQESIVSQEYNNNSKKSIINLSNIEENLIFDKKSDDLSKKILLEDDSLDLNGRTDSEEQVYCYCRQPGAEGDIMIGCDGENCKYEWFHMKCLGLMEPPTGLWYCPECEPPITKGRKVGKRRL